MYIAFGYIRNLTIILKCIYYRDAVYIDSNQWRR